MNEAKLIVSIGIALAAFFLFRSRQKRSNKLPPGPRGLPILGNMLDWPQTQNWIAFKALGEKYGGIVHVSILGKDVIILNDAKHATEMLDKKGRLYSDRPILTMAGQLIGWDQGPALSPFGSRWSEYRKLMSQFIGTKMKVSAFSDLFQQESLLYLQSILAEPTAWVEHTRRYSGSLVLMVTYGYKAKDHNDELVKLVDTAMDQFSETTTPNAFLVDVFPILRFVPSWMPGAAWKRKASIYKKTLQEMLRQPFFWTKQQMAAGSERSCFVSQALSAEHSITSEREYIIQWAAGGMYSGGAESTVAGVECFILAMVLCTAAQQKAQEEIDRVIGVGVLPTLADRARLPYVEALFLEVLRKYTFAPIGLPHLLSEDDVHDGYYIPKGSMIITNVWQFFQDPSTYPDPERFLPERFINAETMQKDPRDYLFGFGRRQCPGIHFADASLWLACVSLLAVFNMKPVVKNGVIQYPPENYVDGVIRHPEPFECLISPRRDAVETRKILNMEGRK